MSRACWSALAVLAFTAVMPGCSNDNGNPKLEDVAKQYGAAYCVKLEDCMGEDAFAEAFPGGQRDCASTAFHIVGTDEQSVCPQEQWDKCASDLKKSTCVTDDAGTARPKIPDSCQGC